jgi:hypothetical protein
MQASRNLEPDGEPVIETKSRPEAEESYIRIKRADLERVLALVERLESRIH